LANVVVVVVENLYIQRLSAARKWRSMLVSETFAVPELRWSFWMFCTL